MIVFQIVFASCLLIFILWKWKGSYWQSRNIPCIEAKFPFGSIADIVLMRKTIGEVYDEIYYQLGDAPFGGIYRFWWPALFVKDPELIKTVFVKEFPSFHDNDYYVNPDVDPILGLNPFNSKVFSDKEMAAHSMTFFLDGFETTAILLGFILYELSLNALPQEKLRQELLKVGTSLDDFEFDMIHEAEYLDRVVMETLRMHPSGTSFARSCTQDITLRSADGREVFVEKGTPIILPMYSVHNDSKYFPNPDVFDPERFTEENKATRPQFSFFPFGGGPRTCPAQQQQQIQQQHQFSTNNNNNIINDGSNSSSTTNKNKQKLKTTKTNNSSSSSNYITITNNKNHFNIINNNNSSSTTINNKKQLQQPKTKTNKTPKTNATKTNNHK
ncbi:unnamed protein product [Nesidiocoris tenuis]|uniref:Cytochrome P450 n=1 Tax=Nesidiocoris tenuis TaxID=355587 RepID=A0A6H5GBN7_9HEMI|nr:unnamed protein product [Nesidiocoris tenuis]